MAIFQIDFFSKCLNRKVPLVAVIPIDVVSETMSNSHELFKTIYLLHGYIGNHLDWLVNVPLTELAEQYNTAIILPYGENSFYLNDEIKGDMYEDFICNELPNFCQRVFPLSKNREDITIGGLSMGGFGAIHSGLAHSETFGNIIALSSALITDNVAKLKEGMPTEIASYSYFNHIFGPLDKLIGSHKDPKFLVKELKVFPNLYMACGTEDFLIEENRDFHKYLDDLGISHEYVEGSGTHDWKFWNVYFEKALAWLNKL